MGEGENLQADALVGMEPDVGLDPESESRVHCLIDQATQAPLFLLV